MQNDFGQLTFGTEITFDQEVISFISKNTSYIVHVIGPHVAISDDNGELFYLDSQKWTELGGRILSGGGSLDSSRLAR